MNNDSDSNTGWLGLGWGGGPAEARRRTPAWASRSLGGLPGGTPLLRLVIPPRSCPTKLHFLAGKQINAMNLDVTNRRETCKTHAAEGCARELNDA